MSEFYLLFENCKSLEDKLHFDKYDGPVQSNHKHLKTRAYIPKLLSSGDGNINSKQMFLNEMCKYMQILKKNTRRWVLTISQRSSSIQVFRLK